MPKPAANIHDAFFKKVLGDAESAGLFLREHLPPDVAELLGPDPPERLDGSFVDEALGQHQSDLLFSMRLQNDTVALAYLLMEHKSAPDPLARLQLLRYVVRILARWYDQNKQLPLPPVLPLLAHHGPKGWKLSCEFADLFGKVPTPLRQYLPSFRHALVDLALIDDGALSAQVRLRAFLKALKYALRPDLPMRLDILLAEAGSLDTDDLVLILTYIVKGPAALNDEAMIGALHRVVPDREKQIMTRFGQMHFDEGIAKGIAKGRAEGEASALARLLERRFGGIPVRFRRRISSADLPALQTWFERAIDAPDLPSVFGPG